VQFQGVEQFRCSPARLFAALTEPDQFVATIPDVESSETIDARRMRCVVRPGFSFLRGTLKLEIEFVDLQPPTDAGGAASMRVQAKGIGATIDINSQMRIEPTTLEGQPGATLSWNAEVVKLSGLVATVSKPLIQAAAGTVAKDTWRRVRERVEQAPA
jgi:carbon monoxide dehydrogenase subunit G